MKKSDIYNSKNKRIKNRNNIKNVNSINNKNNVSSISNRKNSININGINKAIYFFIIGTILGWILEIVFKTITGSKITAGMSYGPFCMLYGIGIVILTKYISKIKNNIFLTFIVSSVILTFSELVTGILLDRVFGIELWNYSYAKLPINKYICGEFMIMWGIAGVIYIKCLMPVLNKIYKLLIKNEKIKIANLSFIYFVFLIIIVDYTYSAAKLIDINIIS